MDRLDEFTVLLAIIDTGSLVAAARHLNRSPPAITRTLASLEARVGDKLIARSARYTAPTPSGLAVAVQARSLLETYAAAVGTKRDLRPSRRLRVTAPVQFGRRHVAPLVEKFLEQHRELSVDLLLQDRTLDLVDEGIDIAVRIGSSEVSGGTKVPVGKLNRVIVGSKDYLKGRGIPKTPDDLAAHDVILSLRAGYPVEWRFSRTGRRGPAKLNCRFAVDDVETLTAAVLAGRGLGRFLSYQVFDELKDGRLRSVLSDFEPSPVPVSVLTRASARNDPLLSTFVDRLANGLKKGPVLKLERPL
jgi:DNA-binding transcriptional LysR family regulator